VNTGEKITAVRTVRLGEAGSALVFVGTKRGNVFVYDLADGELRGRAASGRSPVQSLVRTRDGCVLAAKKNGEVLVLRLENT